MNGQAVSPLPRAGILFRVLWVIAPLAIVVVVLSRLAEFSAIAGALAGASPIWLGAAVICTALYTVNQSLVYQGVFRLMGAAVPFGDALGLTLVMAFASLALPAGTATGVTYFVSEARRRRVAAPLALLTALGYYLFDYGAFVPILLTALVVLHGASDAGVLSLIPLSVFLHTAGIGVLGAIFVALGWTVPLSALISAYAVGGVFMVVSITPSGTGVVEPVMMLVLAGFLAWRLAR